MINAVDLVLAVAGPSRAGLPRLGWLSRCERPAVTAVCSRLGVDVEVVDPGDLDALTVGPDRGRRWGLLTADAGSVPSHDLDRFEHLARRRGAAVANAAALRLAAEPVAALDALAAAGFPTTVGGAPDGSRHRATVARRPSGWWQPVPAADGPAAPERAVDLAVAVADGLDVAGVVAVEVVAAPHGDVLVESVRVGPDPHDPASVAAHVRGLLDLPLGEGPAAS
ncbi:MAG: hypothetical protein KDB10_22510 [Acidimicrobiales bacterium]|nr:hypothetical protein [Acidimicrobiales bacterium]